MRLGQLARKLTIRTTEIVRFLASNSIQVEDGANTRLEDEHVKIIIEQFAPHLLQEILEKPQSVEIIPSPIEELATVETEQPVLEEDTTISPQDVSQPLAESTPIITAETPETNLNEEEPMVAITEELPSIIRAPKIELTGLKVLGKIELPEKKKKEEVISEEEIAPETVTPPQDLVLKTESRERIKPRDAVRSDWKKQGQRSNKNPLEMAREKERKEAEEKRRAEAEKRKEIRTQNYLRKVKAVAPVKKTKSKEEEEELPEIVIENKQPTTLWGRFIKWLTSY